MFLFRVPIWYVLTSMTWSEMTNVRETRSFIIDYKHDCFLKDGKPFNYIAGGFHYFRVPWENWNDRLEKARALGLNAIQTYVAWNVHEPQPGTFDFQGQNDLVHFIELCAKNDLLVVLRPGPYIDAEWEYGGFPYWLTTRVKEFRTSHDEFYLWYVKAWFSVLLPKLKPLLYKNGGPIISIQVENEYSNYYACDHEYLRKLKHIFETYLGVDSVILFTTDSHGWECGSIPELLTTIDFGIDTNIHEAFQKLRKFQPHGPLVNSEFYTGWQDFWGQPHARRDGKAIAAHLDKMLAMNVSVNLYMFQGGTNFAFMNGNDVYRDDGFVMAPTTYDYDAPLSEAGDPTEKYFAIQRIIGKYQKLPLLPAPKLSKKIGYGKLQMTSSITLSEFVKKVYPKGAPFKSVEPLTMEDVGQAYGFLLYRAILPHQEDNSLSVLSGRVHDRSIILIDGKRHLTVERGLLNTTIENGKNVEILVENQGRLCYGSHGLKYLPDPKGIIGRVEFNSKDLKNWEMYPLDDKVFLQHFHLIDSVFAKSQLNIGTRGIKDASPMLYAGSFTVKVLADTYIKMRWWGKGQIFINKFNVGRYWQTVKGPQKTLYVPQTFLTLGVNCVFILELDETPCGEGMTSQCYVELVDKPILV